MREIKFRGYSSEELIGESQWLEGYGVTTIEYTDNTETTHLFTPYGDYRVEKDSIGQYTGLKDKNGKEIYEGDIVSFKFDGNIKISDVKYKLEKGFYVQFESYNNSFELNISTLRYPSRNTTIIGNIYENKDLLEK